MRRAAKKDIRRATVINKIKFTLPSLSVNEGVARAIVSAFIAQIDPLPSELADIKCALSEAVTNCIVHAYKDLPKGRGTIFITVKLTDLREVIIEVNDKGCGIADVKLARTPLYTTDAEDERSGMGFTVMESFMDKVRVSSRVGKGTRVTLIKQLREIESL